MVCNLRLCLFYVPHAYACCISRAWRTLYLYDGMATYCMRMTLGLFSLPMRGLYAKPVSWEKMCSASAISRASLWLPWKNSLTAIPLSACSEGRATRPLPL